MTFCCNGIGISTTYSIAIGKVHTIQRGQLHIKPRWVGQSRIRDEVQRFRNAVTTACQELHDIKSQLPASTAPDIVEFIDTHLLMMEDQTLTSTSEDIIRQEGCSAEWALQLRRDALVKVFDQMTDPYLRSRRDDLDHVVTRIQKHLLNINTARTPDLKGKIIVARDLTPADTILMKHQGIMGFVTEFGGPMSHTAILAKSLNIPAVVGVQHVTDLLRENEVLIIDGLHGIITVAPEEKQLSQFMNRLKDELGYDRSLRDLASIPATSLDGEEFQLMANIELIDDIDASRKNGATAIGLYRTEFLYMNRETPPTEEEHFASYRQIIENMEGRLVTIRTLDLGSDKTGGPDQPTANNPALGLRAIRLCLKESALFKTQLRAIIRASAFGPIRLMLPMLTSIREIEQTRALIHEIHEELKQNGIAFDPNMPVGGMIEVPAAALSASNFASRLDFLSIGTNDLIQYTLAIDRVDDEVNYLYDPLHPAVIKLIILTITASKQANIPVSMCGEMASNPYFVLLLAGLGMREFSMQPNALLAVKKALISSNIKAITEKVSHIIDNIDALDEDELISQIFRLTQP